jgi:hypothetical protein
LKRERKWVMLCWCFVCLQLNYFIAQELCFERIWKGQIRWAMRIFLGHFPIWCEKANRKVNLMKRHWLVEKKKIIIFN